MFGSSRNCLVTLLAISLIWQSTRADEEKTQDPIESELKAARFTFDKSVERIEGVLELEFEKQIKVAAAAAKLEDVEKLQAERDAFKADKGKLPTVRAMQLPKSRYQRDLKTFQNGQLDAFDLAIAKYTKAERFDEAKAVRELKKQFQVMIDRAAGEVDTKTPPRDAKVPDQAKIKDEGVSSVAGEYGKRIWALTKEGRDDVLYRGMLGQYYAHNKGDRPFFTLSIPNSNLWVERVQQQMKGTIDLANVGCSGRGWLVVPKDDLYTIVSPSSEIEGVIYIDGKSPGYRGGDIELKKGVYDITYRAGTYGRDELSKISITITHKKTKEELPIVCTESEIKAFFETRPQGYRLVEQDGFKLTKVALPKDLTAEISRLSTAKKK